MKHNSSCSPPTPLKMKHPTPPRWFLAFILSGSVSVSAQMIEIPAGKIANGSQKTAGLDHAETSSFASDNTTLGLFQLPEIKKAQADLSEPAPVFVNQNAMTLADRQASPRKTESVLDLSALREISAYRNTGTVKMKVSAAQTSRLQEGLAELSAAYRKPGEKSETDDCQSVAMSVGHRVRVDVSTVLQIVESEVAANPGCACEIVKTAIEASGADETLVADITEVAITAAPESMRMISQCAIAAMPEALPAIQAVLAKLDPNRGDSSYSSKDAKSGKDAKAAVASEITPPEKPADPLDLPPPFFPPLPPPPVYPPPPVTDPNP